RQMGIRDRVRAKPQVEWECIRRRSCPRPALRATLSRGEKEVQRLQKMLFRMNSTHATPAQQ
ncbi:hypothetical protein, partial [Xanthomonas phaseoli]|uniref:hypothetical protein n=1 Tax=Xanthomonas phaseoli TaxID=1985254 RepID=UPI001F35D437